MSRGNYKRFDPYEIDSSLTRAVAHRDRNYLIFPYIDGRQSEPRFTSISVLIEGGAATPKDLEALSVMAKALAVGSEWFLNFSTPWLLKPETADEQKASTQRRTGPT